MWNEHFGIGVVEYQAAGLISVVNDSGGPKADIVVPIDGKPTGKCATFPQSGTKLADPLKGFHASTTDEFAAGFAKALELSSDDALAMRLRARKSALRFSEEVFAEAWLKHLEQLVQLMPAQPSSK